MKFILSTPVWSKDYIHQFCTVGLPSLLTVKNIFSISNDSKYIIHCRNNEKDLINSYAAIKVLSQYARVELRSLNDKGNKYLTMSDCHKDALNTVFTDDVPILFIPPDIIWPRNTLSQVIELRKRGICVVHVPGIRLNNHTIIPKLKKNKIYSSQELANLGLQHLHETAHIHMWNEKDANVGDKFYPSHMYWRVGNSGLLIHGFHLHPLMVYPTQNVPFFGTNDDDLAHRLVPDFSTHYVVQDSNQFLLWELDDYGNSFTSILKKGDFDVTRNWILRHTNELHRRLVRYPIRVGENINDLKFMRVEAQAQAIIDKLL